MGRPRTPPRPTRRSRPLTACARTTPCSSLTATTAAIDAPGGRQRPRERAVKGPGLPSAAVVPVIPTMRVWKNGRLQMNAIPTPTAAPRRRHAPARPPHRGLRTLTQAPQRCPPQAVSPTDAGEGVVRGPLHERDKRLRSGSTGALAGSLDAYVPGLLDCSSSIAVSLLPRLSRPILRSPGETEDRCSRPPGCCPPRILEARRRVGYFGVPQPASWRPPTQDVWQRTACGLALPSAHDQVASHASLRS